MIFDLEPGDKVVNPNNKEWGIGQIQSIIKEKITVNFENVGKKVINGNIISLEKFNKYGNKKGWASNKKFNSGFFEAGRVSIQLRDKGLVEKIKKDKTPVTNGDIEVNSIILDNLKKITPDIPIVSEESFENKSLELNTFWLVDPIDGTYDYINNKDEFTLNAGLIINKTAVAGIIYAPAKKRMFYSYGNNISYELKNNKEEILNNKSIDKNNIKAVSYSNKLSPEILELHKKLNVKDILKWKVH